MKHFYLIFLFPLFIFSQEQRPISTAFSFLLVSSDAIASGKGDAGVASLPDAFSQFSNSSKYVFSQEKSKISMSFTPYLSKITQDVFTTHLSFYRKNHRSAWATSFRYFSVGQVELTEYFGGNILSLGNFRPTEWTVDISYNLKLSERFAMGVAGRYLHSGLQIPAQGKSIVHALAFDFSGYYFSDKHLLNDYLGSYTLGFQISNIGTKIKYTELGYSYFLPMNLKIGGGYSLDFDVQNQLSLSLEMNKLLVPSENRKHSDTGFLEGIFISFSDAPNGFKEEFREVSWSIGAEYTFEKQFSFRTGYFYQHPYKGNRNYLTFGAGFALKKWQADFSYLFSMAKTPHPLEDSLRISLQYTFL